MPQTCPACLWISSDEAEECERCGEPFSGRRASSGPAGALGNTIKIGVALFGLGVIAAVGVQRLGDRFPALLAGLKSGAQTSYTWLMGPNEIYKPYLITVLVISVLVWLVLWLLAKLNNS
jgi:hypothetical protein